MLVKELKGQLHLRLDLLQHEQAYRRTHVRVRVNRLSLLCNSLDLRSFIFDDPRIEHNGLRVNWEWVGGVETRENMVSMRVFN